MNSLVAQFFLDSFLKGFIIISFIQFSVHFSQLRRCSNEEVDPFAAAAALCVTTLASAQPPDRWFDLPKFTQPPTLDGDRMTVADEWAGALEFPCSPSQIQLDGQEYGWRDQANQQTEVSTNQLNENGETEVAGEGRTDAD